MRRGTTPTNTITFPCDSNRVVDIRITYKQNGETVFEKTMSDCTLEGNTAKVRLTQEETLSLKDNAALRIQAKALLDDGTVLANGPTNVRVEEIFNEEVLS